MEPEKKEEEKGTAKVIGWTIGLLFLLALIFYLVFI